MVIDGELRAAEDQLTATKTDLVTARAAREEADQQMTDIMVKLERPDLSARAIENLQREYYHARANLASHDVDKKLHTTLLLRLNEKLTRLEADKRSLTLQLQDGSFSPTGARPHAASEAAAGYSLGTSSSRRVPEPVTFPGPVCELIAEMGLARDGLFDDCRAAPDWGALFRPSPIKCLFRVHILPEIRQALKILVQALNHPDRARVPLSCVVASSGAGKTDFFLELASIIQAVSDNNEEVMAALLEDAHFDPQILKDLEGAVVMGITFNSSMMLLTEDEHVAAIPNHAFLHVMLRAIYAEVACLSPDASPQNFADFMAGCRRALGVTLTADIIQAEVAEMLKRRANRGVKNCPLIVLADEVFLVSTTLSKKHYPGYSTSGDATRSYLCKTMSLYGGVVGMSSLLNDDMMRERQTGTLRPVFEMTTLPPFDSEAVFTDYLDQMAEIGLHINTGGELLQWEVKKDESALVKGAYRRSALLAVLTQLVGRHARFTVAVAQALLAAEPGTHVWDVIRQGAVVALVDRYGTLWRSEGGTQVIARALLGQYVRADNEALRLPSGDLITNDEARRLGYVLGSGGEIFEMVLPAFVLFKLLPRYAEPEQQRQVREARDAAAAAAAALPRSGGSGSSSLDSDGSFSDTDVSHDSGSNGIRVGDLDGGRNDNDERDSDVSTVCSEGGGPIVNAAREHPTPVGVAAEVSGLHGLTGLLQSSLRAVVDGKMLWSGSPLAYEIVMCRCEAALAVCRAACVEHYAAITPHMLYGGGQPGVARPDVGGLVPLFGGSGPAYVGSGPLVRRVLIDASVQPSASYVERRKLGVLLSWVRTDKEPMLFGRVWPLQANQAALDAVIFFPAFFDGHPTVVGVQYKTHTQEEKEGKALGFGEVVTMADKLQTAFENWDAWEPHVVLLVAVRRRVSTRFAGSARKASGHVHKKLQNTIVLCEKDVYRYLGPTFSVFVEGLGLLYSSNVTDVQD